MSDEDFYDKEVAPKLLELGKLCEQRGMSFVCFVEYLPEHFAETACVKAKASFAFRLILWAGRCRGNIDSLMIAVQRWAQKYGHSSAILNILKVPTSPPSASTNEEKT